MRTLALLGLLSLTAAACSNNQEFSVGGKNLEVVDMNYGKVDGYFCPRLASGQYMVILSSFMLCEKSGPNPKVRYVMHAEEETNIRLVFPSALTQVPKTTKFQVGEVDPDCAGSTAPGTQAVAFFSHQTEGDADYDLNQAATGGSMVVNYPSGGRLSGTFDLDFGGTKVKGTFDAAQCKAINESYLN